MNRVVAFLGPLFALAAGGAAAWLGQHFPGLEVETDSAAATIAAAIEFAVGAGVAGALQYRWLRGWQRWETGPGGGATASASELPGSGSGTGTGTGTGTGMIVEPVDRVEPFEVVVVDAEPDEAVTGTHADAEPPDAAPHPGDVPHPEDDPRAERPVALDDPFAPAR